MSESSSSTTPPASGLTIGQVARNAGVGVETVRFYERQGLIARPDRPDAGYRRYSHEVVRRIRFIRRAKDLGFTLAEIQELLELRADPVITCSDVRERAAAKIQAIDDRMRGLERMRGALQRLVDLCPADGPLTACPILEMLGDDEPPS
jgi:Hg(II)-responsive transcriptional regulator